MILLTATNLFSVGSYGEFEFWFSTMKVAAIGVFIVLGVLAIFGLLPGTHSVGASNLTGQGGVFPHGVRRRGHRPADRRVRVPGQRDRDDRGR